MVGPVVYCGRRASRSGPRVRLLNGPPLRLFAPVMATAQGAVFTYTQVCGALLVADKETVTCALNLRSHHPALIDAGVAELQRPIS